jgi:hypothetical protein
MLCGCDAVRQPSSIVDMDVKQWMTQRGLDCFFFGFANTHGALLSHTKPKCKGFLVPKPRRFVLLKTGSGL